MAGTVAMTSRDSEVTIGVIMKARMRPAVKNEAPLTGGPNRGPSTGTALHARRDRRYRLFCSQGANTRMPHRPQTTEGTTASRSITYTIGRAQRGGTTSVSSRAMPTLTGTAMTSAITAVTAVPYTKAIAPNLSWPGPSRSRRSRTGPHG